MRLKSSKHLLPIGTLVKLDPKKIDERYYRPRRFLSSNQIPAPWTENIDWRSEVIRLSAHARLLLKNRMSASFQNYPNLQEFCMSALVQIKSDKSKSIQDAMKNMGLTHIFAVSGFHVSILSLFVLFTCRLFRFNFFTSFIILSIFLVSYAVVTGFSASIFRAFVFSLILFPKKLLYQDIDRVHILSMICFIHLLLSPLEIFSIGFQLSYGITFLLLFYSRGSSSSMKLRILQVFTMQLCIYIYFLFYFQEFPLFSFVGVFLTPIFSVILMAGFLLLFTPILILELFLFKYLLGFFEVILMYTFSFGESLSYILTSDVAFKLWLVLPSFLVIIAVYIVLEKLMLRSKKNSHIQAFLKHLVSISGKDFDRYEELSNIQKWELEYLIYKNMEMDKKTRLNRSFDLCLEWLLTMKLSKIEVFIDILLNSFYKDLYLQLCKSTLSGQNFQDFNLDLDRFMELEIGGRLVSCDHLNSMFMGFCKRSNILLTSSQMRAHLQIGLSYQRFQNLRNYDQNFLLSSILFIKYLSSTYLVFKEYSK
ncbi:MAG: ComEC/Rec2 family competence protein [Candidatus Cloacimonetes bacterium]|nr:ComEC/Rec2 family competence protein [Candidatus Cloacimonadota bacterium]